MLPRSIWVSASQLSLDQSAVLAGMLKGPEIYNPLYSVENATNRRNTVLQNMVAAGYIDQKTADQSAAVDIHGQLVDAYEASRRITATHPILMRSSMKRSMNMA